MRALIHGEDAETGYKFVYETIIKQVETGVHIFISSSKANMRITVDKIMQNCKWISKEETEGP